MKTRTFIIAILASMMALPISAKSVELSFNYQKQSGAGSNQYAVWVENSEGKVVRTLVVTSFTSKGIPSHLRTHMGQERRSRADDR